MAKIKKELTGGDKGVEKLKPPHCWWESGLYSRCGTRVAGQLPYDTHKPYVNARSGTIHRSPTAEPAATRARPAQGPRPCPRPAAPLPVPRWPDPSVCKDEPMTCAHSQLSHKREPDGKLSQGTKAQRFISEAGPKGGNPTGRLGTVRFPLSSSRRLTGGQLRPASENSFRITHGFSRKP